jgi:hypothetical protein
MASAGTMVSGGAGAGVMTSAIGQAGTAGVTTGNQAGVYGSVVAGCAGAEVTTVLGIAAGPLDATPSLRLSAAVQLLGDGLASTLMTQQFGQAGLRWQGDRMYMLTDKGFWDVPVPGPARSCRTDLRARALGSRT